MSGNMSAWPADAAFSLGEEVELSGLSKVELNGARGVVTSYDAERGRFSVRMSSGGGPPIAVRPQNLAKAAVEPDAAAEDEDEEAEHAAWLAALHSLSTAQLGEELLEAARYGEAREVGELLAARAQVDYIDAGCNSALHRACANGHKDVVLALAAAGASLLRNESGNLPLHWAVQQVPSHGLGGCGGVPHDPYSHHVHTPIHTMCTPSCTPT